MSTPLLELQSSSNQQLADAQQENDSKTEHAAITDAPDAYPYESDTFHQCWWTYLAPKFDIPYKHKDLLIHRKPFFGGLLFLKEVRIAGWNNAWSQDLTTARLNELEELNQAGGWDYFQMKWCELRQSHQALEQLWHGEYPVIQRPAPVEHMIDLSGGFEAYLSSLSHNGRKSLKKKRRRGEELNPTLVPINHADEIEPFFEELFKHHIAYWSEKAGDSYFNAPEERSFIIHWAKALHPKGQLVLDRLIMGGETVNMSMGVVSDKIFYWLLTINSGLHAEYAPGLIGMSLRAEQAAQNGLVTFNMGAGDYFYKVQSANSQNVCHEIIAFNPKSLKGKAYYHWLKSRPVQAEALQ